MDNSERPAPGKRIGKGMWIATWLMGLALLTLFFGAQEKSWLNPNQAPETRVTQTGIQEVTLLRNRQGHYLVSGKINNLKANFLVDTGATDVVISANLANRYGLERGMRKSAYTANGRVTVYSTIIDQLTVGNITLHHVQASINPDMDDLILLGMSALQHVEFSQRDNTLTLRYSPNL